MDKIDIAKKIAGCVVAAGVSRIVGGFIKNNTDPQGLTDKVAIGSAALVIGSMAAGATKAHTDQMIDHVIKTYNEIVEEVKKKINTSES